MRQLILRGLSGGLSCIVLSSSETSLEDLQEKIHAVSGVPAQDQRLVLGARNLTQDVLDSLSGSDVIFVSLSLRVAGGKGGFGSLLRGGPSGPGAKKITNFGSMRDLQGRRIKDVEKAKKIAKAIARQKGELVEDDEDESKSEDIGRKKRHRRQVLRKKERVNPNASATPASVAASDVNPDEVKYSKQRKEILDNVQSAVEEGLKRAKELERAERKRKRALAKAEPAKIFGTNLEDELLSSSDEEEGKEKEKDEGDEPKEKNQEDGSDEYEWVSVSASGSSSSSSDDENDANDNNNAPEGAEDDEESPTRGLKRPHPESSSSSAVSDAPTSSSSLTTTGPTDSIPAAAPSSSTVFDEIDLNKFESAKALEALGLDHLKHELTRLGLLCGGNLAQRAERLFSIKGKSREQFDPSILAGNQAKRRKK